MDLTRKMRHSLLSTRRRLYGDDDTANARRRSTNFYMLTWYQLRDSGPAVFFEDNSVVLKFVLIDLWIDCTLPLQRCYSAQIRPGILVNKLNFDEH